MTRALVACALLLTACASPSSPVIVGKGKPTVTGAATPAPSPVVSRASRQRPPTPKAQRQGRAVHSSRLSVTAYCATGHRTASGKWPRVGMAAGNRWPFGTRLRVEGWGVVTITDRVGHGSDLDIFLSSCQAARQFGRRHLLVTKEAA